METVEQWIQQNKETNDELKEMRRYLHQNAEVGSVLPVTQAYIIKKLTSWGYHPVMNPNGSIYVVAGKKEGKVLLLRSDMDALPIQEQTDLSFQSINGNMHACGHDLHAAMMLETARLCKEKEEELMGKVKIVFQPHEEGLVGCRQMIEDGIMESPHVDAAIGLHVLLGTNDETGTIGMLTQEITASSTIFEIEVQGVQAHGSMPEEGVDAIRVAVHIYQALQELIPKEIHMHHANVLSIGVLRAGIAHNVIPDHAYMKCSLRCFKDEDQIYLMKRTRELVKGIASLYHATANIKILQESPCVYNDPEFTKEIISYQQSLFGEKLRNRKIPLSVSEDFAHISKRVPSLFVTLACGRMKDGYIHGHHNACAVFDEACMMYGTYFLFTSTLQWLNR